MCLGFCPYLEQFSYMEIIIYFLCGVLFMVANLLFAHKLSAMFDKGNNHT